MEYFSPYPHPKTSEKYEKYRPVAVKIADHTWYGQRPGKLVLSNPVKVKLGAILLEANWVTCPLTYSKKFLPFLKNVAKTTKIYVYCCDRTII